MVQIQILQIFAPLTLPILKFQTTLMEAVEAD